jgi:hypothetical protein
MQRNSASPPPGTIPSATAAFVALIASSSASFLPSSRPRRSEVTGLLARYRCGTPSSAL